MEQAVRLGAGRSRSPGCTRRAATGSGCWTTRPPPRPGSRSARPPQLYAQPLANALSFYQNERDGPDFIRSALRTAPGHLNDASAMTYRTPAVDGNGNFKGSLARYATGVRINATGGWFDAGDYLHFIETTSYTEAILLQGIASFPSQMGAARPATDFTSEARFGLDFLQRMWDEQTRTLYYQVGTGEANNYYFGDHDIWRLPQADDRYAGTNPRYQLHPAPAGVPGRPSQARGSARTWPAAGRRLRALLPGVPQLRPGVRGRLPALRRDRVRAGGHALEGPAADRPAVGLLPGDDLAGRHDAGRRPNWPSRWPTRIPATCPGPAGPDAALPARRRALGQRVDPRQAALSDTLNLYDVSALADYELDLALRRSTSGGLAVTSGRSCWPTCAAQIRKGIHVAASDPFGFGFAWDQYDTTTHGAGLTVMADEYDALTGRPVYAAWAQRWLDDILGGNAWGVSLIVGDGTVFPDCMQHQVTNLAGSHDGQPPVLAGAAVEGPNSFAATGTVPNMRPCTANAPGNVPYAAFNGHKAVFADNVQSYSTVEPAIDLTALTPLAFAWQVARPDAESA